MATTPNMNLDLPTVSVTLGPEYADMNNAAFERIDSHTHSSGDGVKITPAGIKINQDLPADSNRVTELKSTQYDDQSVSLTGVSNIRSVYFVNGDLWMTSGSGTAVQITSGGSIVSTPGAVTSLQSDAVSTDLTISPSDNYVLLRVDTSAARNITLPLASSVAVGRIYILEDSTGTSETNPITVTFQGSDTCEGVTSLVLESNWSSTWFTGDGISKWART